MEEKKELGKDWKQKCYTYVANKKIAFHKFLCRILPYDEQSIQLTTKFEAAQLKYRLNNEARKASKSGSSSSSSSSSSSRKALDAISNEFVEAEAGKEIFTGSASQVGDETVDDDEQEVGDKEKKDDAGEEILTGSPSQVGHETVYDDEQEVGDKEDQDDTASKSDAERTVKEVSDDIPSRRTENKRVGKKIDDSDEEDCDTRKSTVYYKSVNQVRYAITVKYLLYLPTSTTVM
jgi:hypothetical protein